MVSELNTILAREGNLEEIIKANTDKAYRNELLKKYRLLKWDVDSFAGWVFNSLF